MNNSDVLHHKLHTSEHNKVHKAKALAAIQRQIAASERDTLPQTPLSRNHLPSAMLRSMFMCPKLEHLLGLDAKPMGLMDDGEPHLLLIQHRSRPS
jgi:hypothetical protein